MPTYDYVCKACGHKLEIFQSITESAKKKCPECKKSKLERQLGSGAAILFKGSGFYQTDYRSDSYRAGEKADKSDATPASPSDAKPAEPPKPAPKESPKDSNRDTPRDSHRDSHKSSKKKH
ncbi:MAG: zinc ribbon domain-containing protein [Planctomycetes bacterium]|nr:zinc ribbon domain-containing protein [Planctomycetota bacterium]